MPTTRAAAGRLVEQVVIRILKKGKAVDLATVKGPIRLQLMPSQGDDAKGVSQSELTTTEKNKG